MEHVPPPAASGWPARGTKRSHGQMSGRETTASTRTRSPSLPTPINLDAEDSASTVNTSSNTNSNNSSPASTPDNESAAPAHMPARVIVEDARFPRGRPTLLRLPSIQELDARRPRDMDYDVQAQQRGVWPPPVRVENQPSHARRTDVIDLTADDDDLYARRTPQASSRAQEAMRAAISGHVPRRPASPPQNRQLFGRATRGPRFAAEIIDLSGDTPRAPTQHRQQTARAGQRDLRQSPPTSPEIQFVRARQISPRRVHAGATPPAARVPNRLNVAGRVAPIEILDDDEDVEIIRETLHHRHIPNVPPIPPEVIEMEARGGPRGFAIGEFIRNNLPAGFLGRAAAAPADPLRAHTAAEARRRLQNFITPNMDFGMAAFDLGYGQHGHGEVATPEREPSVVPILQPPPEGFTRSPQEEDVLLCPACECELSTGEEEVKRQVWLLRKCGHVYCGECAASRNKRSAKKGKERLDEVPPLKKCAVLGCDAKTNGKQMIQLFL